MKRLVLFAVVVLLPIMAAAQDWTEHVVSNSFLDARAIWGEDLDGDGDGDIIAGAGGTTDQVKVYEQTDDGWNEYLLITSFDPRGVQAADIDNDGDPDIVAAGYTSGQIIWWENTGDISNWIQQPAITSTFTSVYSIWVDDISGDGLPDVVGATGSLDEVAWWENVNNGDSWVEHILTIGFDGAHGVFTGDFNNDDATDVVAAAYAADEIIWFENAGDGDWVSYPVGTGDYCSSVCAADFDNDGLDDVVGAIYNDDTVNLWTNNDGSFSMHIIDPALDGSWYVQPWDINDDGFVDVIAGTRFEGVWYYENTGDMDNWTMHQITAGYEDARIVNAFDMDGDSDLDILTIGQSDGLVSWFEQPGGTPDPVTLTLTPQVTVIPPGGGQLVYDVHLVSTLNLTVPGLRYWTNVTLPNGQEFGPLMNIPFTLTPFMDAMVTGLTQNVPVFAPSGQYTFTGRAGYMAGPFVDDSFPFTKEGAAAGSGLINVDNWKAGGEFTVDAGSAETVAVPDHFTVSEAWPNPFNSSTRFFVALPDERELTVSIYDLTGRLVTTLAQGHYSAGQHVFDVSADSWASGIYFVRATAGTERAAQKIVLVR